MFHTPAAAAVASLLVQIDQLSASMASWMAVSPGKCCTFTLYLRIYSLCIYLTGFLLKGIVLDAYTAGETFCNGGPLNHPKVDKEFDKDGHDRFDAILVQLSQLSSSVSIILFLIFALFC